MKEDTLILEALIVPLLEMLKFFWQVIKRYITKRDWEKYLYKNIYVMILNQELEMMIKMLTQFSEENFSA